MRTHLSAWPALCVGCRGIGRTQPHGCKRRHENARGTPDIGSCDSAGQLRASGHPPFQRARMYIYAGWVGVRSGDEDFNCKPHSYIRGNHVGSVSFSCRVLCIEALLQPSRGGKRRPGDEADSMRYWPGSRSTRVCRCGTHPHGSDSERTAGTHSCGL
jgi:hypothetical protein